MENISAEFEADDKKVKGIPKETANPVLQAIAKARNEVQEGVVATVEIDLDLVRPIDELDLEFRQMVNSRNE